jgi:hypothetical protein
VKMVFSFVKALNASLVMNTSATEIHGRHTFVYYAICNFIEPSLLHP